ncbi:MAG: RsmE family RNA methyltransferase [Candidatus Marinimicrobia bacterium]|nr:RsmE family RNA methyltransferase [Candidatus Neomarinimicrobiota bacterium]
MAHERFFHTQNISGDTLTFKNEEHFHLSRVLRKTRGDTVWAIDGEGIAYQTRIRSVEKQQSTAEILRRHPGFGEPSNRVSLAVGIIKPSHWEILLEKAVELGVHDIFPLHTRYTVKGTIKRERSEKILLSSAKQCGRSRIPRLYPVREFREFIRATRNGRQYICDNQENYPRCSRKRSMQACPAACRSRGRLPSG